MNDRIEFYKKYNELRKKAEDLINQSDPKECLNVEKDMQKLIEQLEISYTELDLQNEVLKETQDELELSRKYYNELFQYAPIGYMTLNIKGYILNINLSAARIMHMDKDKLKKKRFQSFIPVQNFIVYDQCLKKLLLHKEQQSCEVQLITGINTQIWVRLNLWLNDINADRDKEIFCSILDITNEKLNNMRLEQKVKERTYELLEAKKKAEELSKIKDQFLANMSHEIRTPMNGIFGMAKILLETELTASQKEYAKTIVGSSEALMVIINDILDLSKIEAGKLELANETFDLRFVIDNVIKILSTRMYEKNLEFASIFSSAVPPCLNGDPVRVKQILLNLLSNAIKFTDFGEIVLNTSVEKIADNSVYIRFEITDTGSGISEDKKELLFKPFSQIDDSMLKKTSGTGLGLTISKKIAQLMGGDIGFQSTFNKGSTFWATLAFTPQKKRSCHQYDLDLKDCRILFVEPYENRRKVLREFLKILNIQMEEADTGKKGQRMLEQAALDKNPFYLCIVDPFLVIDDSMLFWQYLENSPPISTRMIALLSPLDTKSVFLELFSGQITKPITYTGIYQLLFDLSSQVQPEIAELSEDVDKNVQNPLPKHVLVVDDDPTNQQIIGTILEKENLNVSTVNNGIKAIDFLKQHSCDLIFMDLLMPEKDGVETTKEIRNPLSDVYQPRLPIIAMSANAMQAHKKLCLEAGMDDFLSKPINFEKLTDVLKKWLLVKQNEANDLQSNDQQTLPEKLFDLQLMKEYMKNDMSLVQKTIEQFKNNAPIVLEKLKEAVEMGDIFAIDIRAHTIKGNAKSIFSKPLIKIAEQIEMASKKCDLNRIESLIPFLEKQINMILSSPSL